MPVDGKPPWWFDEFSGHRWVDAAEVATYEARNRTDPAAERELLLSLGLRAEHRLIDFGCGNGALVLEAAAMCRSVIAVDPSAAMLDFVRAKADVLGLTNIEYAQAGFVTYEHAGAPVDFAVTRHVLHLLPDFWKVEALRRAHAALAPGGTFYLRELVYSFEPEDAADSIQRWIDSAPADASDAAFSRSFFEEHVREKYSTYAWLFEAMLRRTGFEIRDATYAATGVHARYTCVKQG